MPAKHQRLPCAKNDSPPEHGDPVVRNVRRRLLGGLVFLVVAALLRLGGCV